MNFLGLKEPEEIDKMVVKTPVEFRIPDGIEIDLRFSKGSYEVVYIETIENCSDLEWENTKENMTKLKEMIPATTCVKMDRENSCVVIEFITEKRYEAMGVIGYILGELMLYGVRIGMRSEQFVQLFEKTQDWIIPQQPVIGVPVINTAPNSQELDVTIFKHEYDEGEKNGKVQEETGSD